MVYTKTNANNKSLQVFTVYTEFVICETLLHQHMSKGYQIQIKILRILDSASFYIKPLTDYIISELQ